MSDITLSNEAETRARSVRHAELVSASMSGAGGYSGPWTLNQVQGDEVFHG